MPHFRYIARNSVGENISGTVEAPSAEAAAAELKSLGHFVMNITRTRERQGVQLDRAWLRRAVIEPLFYRVSLRQLAFLFHELHVTTNAGISVGRSLDLVLGKTRNRRLFSALQQITSAVQNGQPLSQEMKRFPTIFTPVMTQLIQVGEQTGDIAGMLGQLARYLDNEISIRRRILTAMAYPIILLVALISIPTVPTLVVKGFRQWLPEFAGRAVPLGAIVLGWWLFSRLSSSIEPVMKAWDAFKIRIPIIGTVSKKYTIARFSRAVAALYQAGVLLPTSLNLAAEACGNRYIRDILRQKVPEVQAGRPLSEVLGESRQFPDNVIHMVHAGEMTGNLDQLLTKVAEYNEDEADASVQRMIFLILPLGVVLGGVLVAIQVIQFYTGYFESMFKAGESE